MILFKQYLHQLLFFLLMLPHNPRSRSRTSRPCHTRDFLFTLQLTQQHIQSRLHEPPRALINMFLLDPLQFGGILLVQHGDDCILVEWCQLLHTHNGNFLRDAQLLPSFIHIQPNLSSAKYYLLNLLRSNNSSVIDYRLEFSITYDIIVFTDAQRMSEQLLTVEVDQWLPKGPVLLSTHHVEVIGWCGWVADLYVTLLDVHSLCIFFNVDRTVITIDHLQEPFYPS